MRKYFCLQTYLITTIVYSITSDKDPHPLHTSLLRCDNLTMMTRSLVAGISATVLQYKKNADNAVRHDWAGATGHRGDRPWGRRSRECPPNKDRE